MAYFDPIGEEAALVRASAERFLADHYGPDRRLPRLDGPPETRPAHWQAFAELGWLGVPYAPDDGGLGLDMADIAPLMEAFGAGLVLEPYIPAVLHCGSFLNGVLRGATRDGALGALIAGDRIDVLADPPAPAPGDTAPGARERNGSWVLDGTLGVLPAAPCAHVIWVPAKAGSDLALFRVDAAMAAVSALRLIDGTTAGTVHFDGTPAERIDVAGDLADALAGAAAMRMAAALADAVGAMDRLLRETLDHVGAREQFARPLSKFQVVQHALADLLVALEEARSMAELSAHVADEPDRARRDALLAAARIKVGDAARIVAHGAVQFHGGMGVSDEVEASHLAKRLLAFDGLYGRHDAHLAAFMAAA